MASTFTKNRGWESWLVSAIFLSVPLTLCITASLYYCSKNFIDSKLRILDPPDTKYLIALLALPLLAQAASTFSLLRKGHEDDAVHHFYNYCLSIMFVCSTSYCGLWLLYTLGFHARLFSFVALACIVILVFAVGFVTYVIMRLPSVSGRDQQPKRDLKDGLTSRPFGALIFFFSVFLGISYLFGFAFAFDDRARLDAGAPPALFMGKSHGSNAADDIRDPVGNGPQNRFLPWPEYVFSYDINPVFSLGASNGDAAIDFDRLLSRKGDLENERDKLQAKANDSAGQVRKAMGYVPSKLPRRINDQNLLDAYRTLIETTSKIKDVEANIKTENQSLLTAKSAWLAKANRDHIEELARAIEDEASYGRGVLLELRENPDSPKRPTLAKSRSGLTEVTSNENQIDEVKRDIRYMLLDKLSFRKAIPRNIDWFELPSSDKLASDSTVEQIREDTKGVTLSDLLDDTALLPLREQNQGFKSEVNRIKSLEQRNLLNSEDSHLLMTRLAEIKSAYRITDMIQEESGKRDKIDQYLKSLQESRQAAEARRLSDPPYNTVSVTLKPIRDTHQYIPLSLMDYMYFTIYTVTTTGYGDIVPTTTYSKFLCSLANILEVFFLVVFFNALLSAKRDRNH